MAIICLGEVIAQGHPADLVESLQGKVWSRIIEKSELSFFRNSFNVISTQLKAGKTQIHIINDFRPDDFKPEEASLEDVYFSKIAEKMDTITV